MISEIPEHRRTEITVAVQRAYQEAGLDPEKLNRGVVPLYDLIRAYPIAVAEIKDLTVKRVAKFLEDKTGQVFPLPESEERPLAGYLYLQEYQGLFYGCIFVEQKPKSAPIFRRRFSVAHELGHYLLHFLPLLEKHRLNHSEEPLILTEGRSVTKQPEAEGDKENVVRSPSYEEEKEESTAQLTITNGIEAVFDDLGIDPYQMEAEADRFAAELLMPKATCYTLAKHYGRRFGKKREVLAGRLAPEFLVSKQAMKRRLSDLQLPENLEMTCI